MLNDLLMKGESVTVPTTDAEYRDLVDSVDRILFTDYREIVSKEERGNAQQIGVLNRLNAQYFDAYLKPEWQIKEVYKAEFEEKRANIEQALAGLNE